MERDTLLQFRKNLTDVLKPDHTDPVLLKWLRATNFNVRKSERLYREHLWAKKIYKIGEDCDFYRPPKVIEKFSFSNSLGVAKDGSPIHYVAMGRGDLKGFVNSLDIIEIGKYCSSLIEADLKRCKEQSKKLGKDISEITFIVDMENFSLRQVFFHGVVETGLDLLQLLQDHYPEVWNHFLIINVPYYFRTIFNIFKPIFRHTILQKMFVAARDQSTSLLLKYIDAEELPVFLGGKLVDSFGNTMCKEFMKFGGIIPEEYYVRNIQPLLQPTDPRVVDVWIGPKRSYNYKFVVLEAGSIIKMEIRTEGGSIGARILYKEFDLDSQDLDVASNEHIDDDAEHSPWKRISPYARLPGHFCPVNNHAFAPWPGIYIYKFDNSWNWMSSRRVIARITVLPPESSLFCHV